MKPQNLLFIFSDQHNRSFSGCYGHPSVLTPNIDYLAERGIRFTSAYCNSPICVPSRASMATGRYVHQIQTWDNCHAFHGQYPSWQARLRGRGFETTSIGKLHFRSAADDNGWSEEINPMHLHEGVGELLGCIRHNAPVRPQANIYKQKYKELMAPREIDSHRYDCENALTACDWIARHAEDKDPWALFIGLVNPHPPNVAPESYAHRYPVHKVEMPIGYRRKDWVLHPAIEELRRVIGIDFDMEDAIRMATANYMGQITFMDDLIGLIIRAIQKNRLVDRTRIIYASDHGEHLGSRGLWGKSSMYDESVSIPLIMAGPDIPQKRTVHTPVSLVDIYPTILSMFEVRPEPEDANLPGRCLFEAVDNEHRMDDRVVFSEYHALGSSNAWYMLRNIQHKFVYYVDCPPQLFDMQKDPQELHDLACLPEYRETVAFFEKQLWALLDPLEINRKAHRTQAETIQHHGGRQAVISLGSFEATPIPAIPKHRAGSI